MAPASRPGSTRGRNRRGQALVEFALVVPLFLLLVAGMIDFGLGLNASITVTNAAREGARLGVVKPFSDAITARATAMTAGLNPSDVTVSATCVRPTGSTPSTCTLGTGSTAGTASTGDSVVVTVTYDYHMVWPLAVGTVIHIGQSSEFRIE